MLIPFGTIKVLTALTFIVSFDTDCNTEFWILWRNAKATEPAQNNGTTSGIIVIVSTLQYRLYNCFGGAVLRKRCLYRNEWWER